MVDKSWLMSLKVEIQHLWRIWKNFIFLVTSPKFFFNWTLFMFLYYTIYLGFIFILWRTASTRCNKLKILLESRWSNILSSTFSQLSCVQCICQCGLSTQNYSSYFITIFSRQYIKSFSNQFELWFLKQNTSFVTFFAFCTFSKSRRW